MERKETGLKLHSVLSNIPRQGREKRNEQQRRRQGDYLGVKEAKKTTADDQESRKVIFRQNLSSESRTTTKGLSLRKQRQAAQSLSWGKQFLIFWQLRRVSENGNLGIAA